MDVTDIGEAMKKTEGGECGCVKMKCIHVFKAGENNVCIRNPPVPVPIPQMDKFTGQPVITIQPVFSPCVSDTVCGEYVQPKNFQDNS